MIPRRTLILLVIALVATVAAIISLSSVAKVPPPPAATEPAPPTPPATNLVLQLRPAAPTNPVILAGNPEWKLSEVELRERLHTLERRETELLAENKKIKTQLNDVLQWIIRTYRGKFPIPNETVAHLRLAGITDDYRVDPEVVEILHITPAEQTRMNTLLTDSRSLYQQLEDRVMTITNSAPGEVIVRVPAFPQEGQLLRTNLYDGLKATLGVYRFNRLLETSECSFKKRFQYFGKASRSIRFQLVYDTPDAAPRLSIRDAWVIEEQKDQRRIEADETIPAEVPAYYVAYLARLPAINAQNLGLDSPSP